MQFVHTSLDLTLGDADRARDDVTSSFLLVVFSLVRYACHNRRRPGVMDRLRRRFRIPAANSRSCHTSSSSANLIVLVTGFGYWEGRCWTLMCIWEFRQPFWWVTD